MRFALAAIIGLGIGCGSSDGESAQKCSRSDDCPGWACTCEDGTVGYSAGCVMGSCESGEEACDSMCGGNVTSYEVVPTLAGTAECNEVCSAVQAAGRAHGSCIHDFCDIRGAGCEASQRSYLQCLTDNVTWTRDGSWAEAVPADACQLDTSICTN